MPQLSIEELPYTLDSAPLFDRIRELGGAIYLDSSAPYSSRGRYDILAAAPQITLSAPTTPNQGESFFKEIRRAMAEVTPPLHNDYHLPFLGGAAGYFSYDLARSLEILPSHAIEDLTLPPAVIGIYSWAIIVDHRQLRTVLISHRSTPAKQLKDIKSCLNQIDRSTTFTLSGDFQTNLQEPQYRQAFEKIKHYIQAGDCYQINLAQRFSSAYQGSPFAAYQALRKTAAAPFSAYMETADYSILSLSPERFLHVGNNRVTTSPIKGTRKRGESPDEDNLLAQQLMRSTKDRAENLMIVDLLRNDLGKACVPGSIQVDELFELQSFETVHHLVSTITGQLQTGTDALSLLAGCFPGGSITGAPKVRAMEIIEELEPHRRSVYCGSLGYISCDGQMDTNIAIRTLVCDQGSIYCWAGGGIVADSDCDSEYEECLNKVGPLLDTLTKLQA